MSRGYPFRYVWCVLLVSMTTTSVLLVVYWNSYVRVKVVMTPVQHVDVFEAVHLHHSNPRRTKVLLVTYYRGGSTFLGEVFNRNDQAIYWFEPLHAVKDPDNEGRDDLVYVRDKNGTWRHHSEEHVTKQLETLVNIFNCQLGQLDKQVLTNKFIKTWDKSSKLAPFRKCLRTQNKTINDCMPVAQKACDQSNIRAIKVIRVGLYIIPQLLAMDPDIKVVFYVRDPRGMFLSSVEGLKQKLSIKHFGNILYPLCKRFEEDFQWIEKLRSHLILLKYEDLAVKSFRSLGYIYSNLGFCESPGQVKRWFKHNTNAMIC